MQPACKPPPFEVADVVRAHLGDLQKAHPLSAAQEKVLRHIATCRTAALGGHVDECGECGHQRISYNSCRDRHCPKCQGPDRAAWLEQRLERLLPIPYFHVVFTLPSELNALVLWNKETIYRILFAAAVASLQVLAADPSHLGAQIGITAILHTWGQNLLFHPHLHCVVTGGGLSPEGDRWIHGREDYLLPVKMLGKLFRGKFLAALNEAWNRGELNLKGRPGQSPIGDLGDPYAWGTFLSHLYRKDWVVYAKPPFGGPEKVFRYLGRYSHRVAISNHRITAFANGRVSFTIKDYADGGLLKTLTLGAVTFLKRFLLHILPKGFVRIRHYGLHAGSNVGTKLAAAQKLLAAMPLPTDITAPCEPDELRPEDVPAVPATSIQSMSWWERFYARTGIDVMLCPSCGIGHFQRIGRLPPVASARVRAP